MKFEDLMVNRIVCAAVKCNRTGIVICGVRHFDRIMCRQLDILKDQVSGEFDEGFVDKFGQYHTRESAWIIAVGANQIIRLVDNQTTELYSENIY